MSTLRDDGWLPDDAWRQPPRPDAVHAHVVHDPDLGTIAELTNIDGEKFYGADDG